MQAAAGNGSRCLNDQDDFVRREIELALRRGKAVIPVLLEDAWMPGPQDLPPSIHDFARSQAVVLTSDRWDANTATPPRTLGKHWLKSHRPCRAAIRRGRKNRQDSAGGSSNSEGNGTRRQGMPLHLSRPCSHPASQALASAVPGR